MKPPNPLPVRLSADDLALVRGIAAQISDAAGVPVSQADVIRLAVREAAERRGVTAPVARDARKKVEK